MEDTGRDHHAQQRHEGIVTSYSLVTLLVPIAALVFVLAYGNLLALNYLTS